LVNERFLNGRSDDIETRCSCTSAERSHGGDHVMTDARTVTAQLQSFKTFRLSLKGSVVLPDDAKYDELRTPWLEVIDQRPAMIVDAECAEDVVASVNFAREHRLSLGVMATGHGIAAPCDGLLLRFTKMNQRAGPGKLD